MTKYKQLAADIRSQRPLAASHSTRQAYAEARATWLSAVFKFSDSIKRQNPKFCVSEFYKACGVGSGD